MLVKGDYVAHNTFPPVEGTVSVIQDMVNSERRIGVLRSDTNTIYYDLEGTWDKEDNSFDDVYESDVIDGLYREV